MEEKHLKGLCIALGCMPFVGILIYSVYSCWDYFSISNYLFEIVYNLMQFPAVFLGLGMIFLGAFIPFRNKKKQPKSNKILWIVWLAIGIIPFVAAVITSIIYTIDRDYGIEGIIVGLEWFSMIFWPLYAIGGFLIVLSCIKLKRNIYKDCEKIEE